MRSAARSRDDNLLRVCSTLSSRGEGPPLRAMGLSLGGTGALLHIERRRLGSFAENLRRSAYCIIWIAVARLAAAVLYNSRLRLRSKIDCCHGFWILRSYG